MHDKILIAVDPDHATHLPEKLDLARRIAKGPVDITVVTVLEAIPAYLSEFVDELSERQMHQKVTAMLWAEVGDADGVCVKVVAGKPGLTIAEMAAEGGFDTVIVGSRRPGRGEYVLGSTAARVVRRAPCSVMVLRPEMAA